MQLSFVVLSQDGLMHLAYFHPALLHAHPPLWWLHAPAHCCADALLTALLHHCEEHPEVSHPVWTSLPENRLRWILLADISNRWVLSLLLGLLLLIPAAMMPQKYFVHTHLSDPSYLCGGVPWEVL